MKEKIFRKIKQVMFGLYYVYSCVAIPLVYNKSFKKGELSYLTKEDFSVWKEAMLKMLKEYCLAGYNFRIRQVIYSFAKSKIEIVRKTVTENRIDIPIVVLCIKNDLQRIQILVDHYRKLGVQKFAFLDNDSNDGTFEWLLEQKDIDLFRCYERYQTAVKEGWINRIVSHYGFNRWFIVTDSDELMVYQGMECHPLSDLTKWMSQKGYKRLEGLTLDTYAAGKLFGESNNIRRDYRWIDADSYTEQTIVAGVHKVKRFVGGPRYRLMKSSISLSKYPLVYWEKGTISDNAHFQFPHNLINESPCCAGILHYKFIDKDLEAFEKRAQKDSGFSAGGANYKLYMDFVKNKGGIGFMYEGSLEFNSSEVLEQLSPINKIDF